jgi:ectoine hydroxylase-related dioxygenase (phytanoyl-CoA dioxygenase family)
MNLPHDYREILRESGFAIVPDVIGPAAVEALQEAMSQLEDAPEARGKSGVYGARHLLTVSPEVRDLAASTDLRDLVAPILGSDAFAVRALFFDKIPSANWKLGWHQDSVIAVRERRDVPGFGPWGVKAGVVQVQPPAEILARMLAVRVHLDDCDAENGPLRVLPGSHCHGWLDSEIDDWKRSVPEFVCKVPRGGAMVMRPLILHASSPAVRPDHRRVVHIEYASEPLPSGLEWHTSVRMAAKELSILA